MAFLLPNLQPYLLTQSKSEDKPLLHQTLSSPKLTSHFLVSSTSSDSSYPLATLQTPTSQVNTPSSVQDKQLPKDEFYVKLGLAMRTLREDMPMIFIKDLNYDIYRLFDYFSPHLTISSNIFFFIIFLTFIMSSSLL